MKDNFEKERLKLWSQWLLLIKSGFWILVILIFYVIGGDKILVLIENVTTDVRINLETSDEMLYADQYKSEQFIDNNEATTLAKGVGLATVKSVCLSCHSEKLITQNRATRAGWKDMIRWMQKTQGLPPLGSKEKIILDYLEKHYAPVKFHRRPPLDTNDIEWYVLTLQ